MNGTINRFATEAIRGADHLAGSQSTASEKRATNLGPVVPAGIFVDDRRAAEFTPSDDRYIVAQAALV